VSILNVELACMVWWRRVADGKRVNAIKLMLRQQRSSIFRD